MCGHGWECHLLQAPTLRCACGRDVDLREEVEVEFGARRVAWQRTCRCGRRYEVGVQRPAARRAGN